MGYPIPNGRGYLSGLGAVTAESLTTTGNVIGAIVRATTALEFPTSAGAPVLRATDDTNTGISVISSDTLVMWTGGIDRWGVGAGIATRNATQVTETGAHV